MHEALLFMYLEQLYLLQGIDCNGIYYPELTVRKNITSHFVKREKGH